MGARKNPGASELVERELVAVVCCCFLNSFTWGTLAPEAAKGEPKNETFPQFLEVQLDLLDYFLTN